MRVTCIQSSRFVVPRSHNVLHYGNEGLKCTVQKIQTLIFFCTFKLPGHSHKSIILFSHTKLMFSFVLSILLTHTPLQFLPPPLILLSCHCISSIIAFTIDCLQLAILYSVHNLFCICDLTFPQLKWSELIKLSNLY